MTLIHMLRPEHRSQLRRLRQRLANREHMRRVREARKLLCVGVDLPIEAGTCGRLVHASSQRCIHCIRRRWWLIKHAFNDAEVSITALLERPRRAAPERRRHAGRRAGRRSGPRRPSPTLAIPASAGKANPGRRLRSLPSAVPIPRTARTADRPRRRRRPVGLEHRNVSVEQLDYRVLTVEGHSYARAAPGCRPLGDRPHDGRAAGQHRLNGRARQPRRRFGLRLSSRMSPASRRSARRRQPVGHGGQRGCRPTTSARSRCPRGRQASARSAASTGSIVRCRRTVLPSP